MPRKRNKNDIGEIESSMVVLHVLLYVCLDILHLPHDTREGDMLELLPLPPREEIFLTK